MTCPPTMSENCLLLNVFTPKNATPDSKLATMLFIHGGNFKQVRAVPPPLECRCTVCT